MLHVCCWELSHILTSLVCYFFVRQCAASIIADKKLHRHSSWPKGLSDIWGISKASSLLRSNHHQCHQCIRCFQETNPRDGKGWQETRDKSRRQALEWAKHAYSLLRCPPHIWRWRRLDAKGWWANSREAASRANSPITVPLFINSKQKQLSRVG